MKTAILVPVFLILFARSSYADEPPIPCCSCTLDALLGLILIPATDPPDPLSTFTVTVRTSGDCIPIHNAVVECFIGGIYDSRTRLCPSTILTGTTDVNGRVAFTIPGGGCYRGANAMVIRANGVEIRNYWSVTSPDYSAWDNVGQPGRWDLRVGLTDLAAFGAAFGSGGSSCHDYDYNGATGVTDLALFGRFWSVAFAGCQ